MGRIYLVAHTKGGCGKSTTTLNLGVTHHQRGHKPGLYDVDVGQSLDKWAKVRARLRPDLPQLPVKSVFGTTAHLDILAEAAEFDDVFVDAGGEGVGSPEVSLILTVADVLITPCGTNGADIVRLENIHGLLSTARRHNKKLRALLVPFKASTNARSNDVVDFYNKVSAMFPEYELAESVIRTRVSMSQWADTGEAISEAKNIDAQALKEMTELYEEVTA